MRRYLLLASVAGCLMNAGNAWTMLPGDDFDNETLSTTMNISAYISSSLSGKLDDMDWGKFITKSDSLAENQLLATFSNGTLTVNDTNVSLHSGGEAAMMNISSGCMAITGATFSPSTVELKDTENHVVAKVTNLGWSSDDFCAYNYVNGQLKAGNDFSQVRDTSGLEVTGTTTVTLEF